MQSRALASWFSSEEDDPAEEEDLVGVLESYTRELAVLCGGMEVQQQEEDNDEDTTGRSDTLTSLEEITGECAALLASLEAAEHRSNEVTEGDLEGLKYSVENSDQGGDRDHEPQEDETSDESRHERLAHQLDSFAGELKEFLSSLEDSVTEENTITLQGPLLEVSCEQEAEKAKETGHIDTIPDPVEHQAATDTSKGEDEAGVRGEGIGSTAEDAPSSHKKQVFSERTKKAIALHVKRLALQKQCRRGNGFRISTKGNANDAEADTEHELAGLKVVWSKFQSSSFQQHIMRQKFARRRVKQIQESRRLVEAARLRGTKEAPCLRYAKPSECKSNKHPEQHATYLDQFRSNSTAKLDSAEFEPRNLCGVYLYGHRRLGTTFVTFNSLAQLEQRIKARFAIEEIVSVYREVTEVVVPECSTGYRATRRQKLKRFHRISSLEHVNDGDTLCVTQNAYDDMTILCDWIKRRQRVVRGFAYQARQRSVSVSALTSEESPSPKAAAYRNTGSKPQLWDSNGRSIGVKTQEGIEGI